MGRNRSRTGRKLLRVRADQYQEIIWEDVIPGNQVESLALTKAAVTAVEERLGMADDSPEARAKRQRTEWRLDSGWGSDVTINYLLERDYQVTTKMRSTPRVRKLVTPITVWEDLDSEGHAGAMIPEPVPYTRPTQQYAVRTPSKETKDGYAYSVLVTTHLDLPSRSIPAHYNGRSGMEADIKGDKYGLGLGALRKGKLAAQKITVLLMALAHNLLLWARGILAAHEPRLAALGIVRLIAELWAIPGSIKIVDHVVSRVCLNRQHPRAPDLVAAYDALHVHTTTLDFLD